MNRKQFLTAAGIASAGLTLPRLGTTAVEAYSTLGTLSNALVVSSEAPKAIKDAAAAAKSVYGDFIQICDGMDDQVEINAAIAAYSPAAPFTRLTDGGGRVHCTKGRFYLSDSVYLYYIETTLEGQGLGTRFVATKPHMNTMITLAEQGTIRDLVTDGNGQSPGSHIWISSSPDNTLRNIQSIGGATIGYIYAGGHVPKRLLIDGFRARGNREGYQIMLTNPWLVGSQTSIINSFFSKRLSTNYNIYIENYAGILIALNQFEDVEEDYPHKAIQLNNCKNVVKGLNTFGTMIGV